MTVTLRCPDCSHLAPHAHSLAMHMFKSGDGHGEWTDFDDTQEYVYDQREELALNLESDDGDGRGTVGSEDGAGTVETAADGGSTGLGLTGPPESEDTANAVEQGDESADASGCPECGGDLKDVPAGSVYALEDGSRVEAESGDEWCDDCTALVDEDGGVWV